MSSSAPRFSKNTLLFIKKASRQSRPDWLEKNRDDYEAFLLEPLKHLAHHLKTKLAPVATGYHFPQKGIGRLRRPAGRSHDPSERGLYKSWLSYSAARPRASRFEHNPNLYFLIQPEDKDDSVLVAGGLYMPSSRQVRAIRESIAADASAFERLFASRAFAERFPGGFSLEKTSTRVPRGFDADHPKLKWIKLQAFFVWRSYTQKEFKSAGFAELICKDWKQILRLNELLDQALQNRPAPPSKKREASLLDRTEGVEAKRRKFDF